VGIELCCRERSVTKEFLDSSQICPSLKDMGSCGVSQPMRCHGRNSVNPLCRNGYRPACSTLIKSPTPGSKKQGVVTLRRRQNGPTVCEPTVKASLCWGTKRDNSLLVSLAKYLNGSSLEVHVPPIQSAKLADSHCSGVEKFQDSCITNAKSKILRTHIRI